MNEVDELCVLEEKNLVKLDKAEVPVTLVSPVKLD